MFLSFEISSLFFGGRTEIFSSPLVFFFFLCVCVCVGEIFAKTATHVFWGKVGVQQPFNMYTIEKKQVSPKGLKTNKHMPCESGAIVQRFFF